MIVSVGLVLGLIVSLSSAIVIDPETANVTEAPHNCHRFCTNRNGTPYCCRYLDEDGNEHAIAEDEKPGICKTKRRCGGGKKNTHYCEVDIDCPGNRKCCSDPCGSLPVCKKPKKNKNRNGQQTRGNPSQRPSSPVGGNSQSQQIPTGVGTHENINNSPVLERPEVINNGHNAEINEGLNPGINNAPNPVINTGFNNAPNPGRPQNIVSGILGQVFQGLNNAGINIGTRPSNQDPSNPQQQSHQRILTAQTQAQQPDGTIYVGPLRPVDQVNPPANFFNRPQPGHISFQPAGQGFNGFFG